MHKHKEIESLVGFRFSLAVLLRCKHANGMKLLVHDKVLKAILWESGDGGQGFRRQDFRRQER
jgi:hypothetical protein